MDIKCEGEIRGTPQDPNFSHCKQRKKFRFQGKGNTFSFNVINLCDILKVIFVVIFLKNNLKPFLSGGIQSVSEVHRNHQSVLDSELHLIV